MQRIGRGCGPLALALACLVPGGGCGAGGSTSPTPTPSSTPAPTPDPLIGQIRAFGDPILATIAATPPDFQDDFSSNDRGWSWDRRMQDQVVIRDGVMKVAGQGGHGIFPPEDLLRSRDFVYELDARLLRPQGRIGTFFRQRNESIWYGVMLSGLDQSWRIGKASGPTIAQGRTNVRPAGEWNRITVIAEGNRFAVYLGAQPTAYFEDATFPDEGNLMPTFSGEPSLPAEGEFDNVRFWRLGSR